MVEATLPDGVGLADIVHIAGGDGGARRPEGLPGLDGSPVVPCCMGAAINGLRGCTCWEPIYDTEQQERQEGPMALRAKCCHDCAYRVGSPEREEIPDFLDEVALRRDKTFACHQGVRRIVGWRHPSFGERVFESANGNYAPPEIDARIWCADGRPGEFCAGWAAVGGRR